MVLRPFDYIACARRIVQSPDGCTAAHRMYGTGMRWMREGDMIPLGWQEAGLPATPCDQGWTTRKYDASRQRKLLSAWDRMGVCVFKRPTVSQRAVFVHGTSSIA